MNNPRNSLDFVTVCCLRLLWDEIYGNLMEVAQDAGLTVTEEQILMAIWLSKESTVTEIAFIVQRDKGTVSKGVYSLELNGLVARKVGQDRRYAVFTLTEMGERVNEELLAKHGQGQGLAFAQGFLNLNEEERDSFVHIAFKLVRYVYGDSYVSSICRLQNIPKGTMALIDKLMEEIN
mgnify:CR=1 FL=1